ncbi:MAG: hypothetical protein KA419_12265 [Acidobacteria bacterium]|nr:hypothetical protein [Acidobacteriota bacterium]
MNRTAFGWCAAGLCLLLSGVFAPAASEVFPLSQVRPGLTGTGKTCILGSGLTEFGFEVLGVMPNIIAGRTIIVVRLSGPAVEKTGVFSGMSGSPIYVDGKLLGALAYAFPFCKEPIAGVTPFEEMRAIFEKEEDPGKPMKGIRIVPPTGRNLESILTGGECPEGAREAAADVPGVFTPGSPFRPIATPLGVSGATPAGLKAFGDLLSPLGFEPQAGAALSVAGATPGGEPPPTVPGSSVVACMIRGDLQVGAGGTVTEVDGKTIYAFGHPFMSTGGTEFPLHASEVITVVPTLSTSFKFFTTGAPIGVIRQDRTIGIQGTLGEAPRMVPVELSLLNSRGKSLKYRFETARDRQLTPLLISLGVQNFLTVEERVLGWETIEVSTDIFLKGGEEIHLRNIFCQANLTPALAAAYVAVPVQYLMLFGFSGIDIERICVFARMREELSVARLDQAWVSKVRVKPGEALRFHVTLRRPDGTPEEEQFSVAIPEDTPPGPIQIYVGDGTNLTQLEQQLEPGLFLVTDAAQLIRVLKQFRQDGTLYVKMYRKGEGIFTHGKDFPALPPSMLEIFKGPRLGGAPSPVKYVHFYEQNLGNKPYAVTGFKTFQVMVEPR